MSRSAFAAAPLAIPDAALTEDVLTRRLAAWAVDACIVTCLVACVWVALLVFGVLTFGLGFPLLGVLPVLPLLYGWGFVASALQATPGQRLLGLTVCRDDDLGRPSSFQALVAAIGFAVTIATGVIWLAAALVTVRRRTLHDLVAGVVVVRTRALTAAPGFWNMAPGGRPTA